MWGGASHSIRARSPGGRFGDVAQVDASGAARLSDLARGSVADAGLRATVGIAALLTAGGLIEAARNDVVTSPVAHAATADAMGDGRHSGAGSDASGADDTGQSATEKPISPLPASDAFARGVRDLPVPSRAAHDPHPRETVAVVGYPGTPVASDPAAEAVLLSTAAPLALNLRTPDRQARTRAVAYAPPGASGFAVSGPDAARSALSGWVADWKTPQRREFSLFVANDDEALSWTLGASPEERPRLAYRDSHVDVGEVSVGVSMALGGGELRMAYMERDASSQLGYSSRQDFAGLVVAARR